MIADIEELEEMDASELHARRLNAKEVLTPMKGDIFYLPLSQMEPFGAMVEYHLFSAKDQSRLHQFGAKVLPGIFLGYALYAGWIWKLDIVVADIEALDEMDGSESRAKRLNAKEVVTPQRSGNFIFPVADGTVKIFGGEQRLRTSTLSGIVRNEEKNKKFFEKNRPDSLLQLPLQDDSTRDDEEAKNDSWTITGEFIHRHHVVPRVRLYVPKEE